MEEIARAGGQAEAVQVDVTSGEQLAEATASRKEPPKAASTCCWPGPASWTWARLRAPLRPFRSHDAGQLLRGRRHGPPFSPLVQKGEFKRIGIISSLAAKISPPYFSAYSASKAAVAGFAHALRQELAPQGIRVVLIHPGPAATPLVDGYLGGRYYPLPPGVPVVSPEHVARAALKAIRKGRREVSSPGGWPSPPGWRAWSRRRRWTSRTNWWAAGSSPRPTGCIS